MNESRKQTGMNDLKALVGAKQAAWATVTAADGHKLQCYATPDRPQAPAIVVLQEIFGVNQYVRDLCDQLGRQGYFAVAPALFDRVQPGLEFGYEPKDVAAAREVRQKIDDAAALLDVAAAVHLARSWGHDQVVVIGFCWGGTLAWKSAALNPDIRGAIAFYGTHIADHLDLAPKVPVMMHFGRSDANIPLEGVRRIAAAYPDLPLHLYDAGHGFACEARAAHEPVSAQLAWQRSRAFLETTLGLKPS